MGNSPTQNTLNLCRREGWTPQVVEHGVFAPIPGAAKVFSPILKRAVQPFYMQRRRDLYGGIDVLVLDEELGSLGVQATSHTNAAGRVAKCRAEDRLEQWVARGNRLEVWAWKKVGHRWQRDVRRPFED